MPNELVHDTRRGQLSPVKQPRGPEKAIKIRESAALHSAQEFFADLLATHKDDKRGAPNFFRFVWTRALGELDWPASNIVWRRESEKVFPFDLISRVSEHASKLGDALDAANAAYRPRPAKKSEPLFSLSSLEQVSKIRGEARHLMLSSKMRGAIGRPAMNRRLYTVAALLPFLKWTRLATRGHGAEPGDEGIWAWLTKWENALGSVHIADLPWLGNRICQGGLRPRDLGDEGRFVVLLPKKNQGLISRQETLSRWWNGMVKDKHNHDSIIQAGAAFIAWRRQLYKKELEFGAIGSTAKLQGVELEFAASAAKTLAQHCGMPETAVLKHWSQIHL